MEYKIKGGNILFLLNALKIIFLLGFLIFIHEGGHFIVAKLCKVKVNEFAIGFGPTLLKKQTKETKYALRLIPLGGYVSMEGEAEASCDKNAFNNASVSKKIAIVSAGAIVNIVFGTLLFAILISVIYGDIATGLTATWNFLGATVDGLKNLFTGQIGVKELTGPIGISQAVSNTHGVAQYLYLLAVVSVSLGITNLLPIPALDGGKIVILLIEAIRRRPLKENVEMQLQLIGFSFLIAMSIYVTYNDVLKVIHH